MPIQGRVVIDGKPYNYTLTPVSADDVAVPAPGQGFVPQAASPMRTVSGDGEVVTVMLLGHDMKSGVTASHNKDGRPNKMAGKTWEKHSFRASDNRTYTTFKGEDVALLSPLVNTDTPVKLRVQANSFKGWDLMGVIGT